MNLPEIPDCKKWNGKSTPEQDILMKIQMGHQVTKEEIEILDCAYEFYEKAFTTMKAVNLSEIGHKEADILKQYLKDVINLELIFQNPVTTGLVFRMTWIADYNEEDGKVRDPNYLSYTPLKVVKANKKLGRANTNESTCLYLAETAQVAVFECKPSVGDRIIISGWATIEDKPLIMYPINSPQKVNLGVRKATDALDKHLYDSNQYFARMIKIIQDFIGSEFIKDVPKINEFRYEYLYSAYFADKVMNSKITVQDEKGSPILGQYDGIIYPSIATKYNYDNIAVRETSVSKLKPVFCHEYLVNKTGYDNFNGTANHLPFEGDLIRESISIDDRINWNDD